MAGSKKRPDPVRQVQGGFSTFSCQITGFSAGVWSVKKEIRPKSGKRRRLGNLFMGLILLQQRKDGWWVISAGMPPIHVFRETSGEVETFIQKTPPLGAFSDYTYTPQPIELGRGDTVLFFSDGLPELFNAREEKFGYNSVRDCFGEAAAAGLPPDGIIGSLREAGDKWRRESPQDDDITFVVLKITQ